MGKNAKRRREAKLQAKLTPLPAETSDGSPPAVFESEYELPAVFGAAKEVITDELTAELVTKHGWKEADILEARNQGMLYCRARNSFTSPPQFFEY